MHMQVCDEDSMHCLQPAPLYSSLALHHTNCRLHQPSHLGNEDKCTMGWGLGGGQEHTHMHVGMRGTL